MGLSPDPGLELSLYDTLFMYVSLNYGRHLAGKPVQCQGKCEVSAICNLLILNSIKNPD